LKSLGSSAFNNCTSLKDVYNQGSLQQIQYSTFEDCINLESIDIPGSVTFINSNAFANCTSLNKVNFGSSKYDWDNIIIADQGNTYLKQAYRTYAKDDYRIDISKVSIEMTSDVKSVIKRINGYIDYPRVKKITYNNDELKAGTDYKIDYTYPDESKKQSTYKVTITGIGRNYTGSKTIEYPVENAVDISKATVTCTPNQVTYNENTKEVTLPEIAVSYGGKTLIKGVDYEYRDTPAIDKYDSKARIYIYGLGKYEGNRNEVIPLKVIDNTKTDLSNAVVELSPAYIIVDTEKDNTYWPYITITLNGKKLDYDDFDVNKELSADEKTGTITITGTGSYTGTIVKTVNVHEPFDISKADVTIDPESITGDQLYGELTWPSIIVRMNGSILNEEDDYDVQIHPNADKGTAEVRITGYGRYTGTYTKTVRYTDTRKNTNAEIAALQTRITELEQQIANLKGSGTSSGSSTTNVIVDQAAKKQIEALTKQVNDLQSALKSMQNLIDQLNTTGKANTEMVIKLIKIDQLENVKAAASKGGLITFSWKKSDVNNLDAYRVYYSTKKNSGFKKLGTTKKLKLTKKVNIKKGKKIYLKIRGYKKVNGKTIWTKYSKVKSVQVK
jgi:prefoldin subunit 5